MKRTREDGPQPLPSKRPASSPGQSTSVAGSLAEEAKLTTNDALSYLKEVKRIFADDREVYNTFLGIMKDFKNQRVDTEGVIQRVKKLFKGYRELILGFNNFLPKGYEIKASFDEPVHVQNKPVEFDQAINYVNKIKTRFINDERVYKAFLEILNMYRKGAKTITLVYDEVAVLFENHNDLLEEFTYFLPDNTPTPQGASRRFQNRLGASIGARPGVPPSGRGPPGVNGPPLIKRKPSDDDDQSHGRPNLQKELTFFERTKQRLRNKEAYTDLLKCLSLYSMEIITRQELHLLVSDIIGKFADLMAGFLDFLNKCEYLEVDDGRVNRLAQQNAQRVKLREEHALREKYLAKPLSEIVANDPERVTPSYVKIPPGYPKLIGTGRTPLGTSVLNDTHVSVITGSEDYSFKLMRKNQYEEALFRCEDDRYEFEICYMRNLACIKHLKPIAAKAASMSPEEKANFRLDDSLLKGIYWKHIERLYGDQGQVLVDLLKKNPALAVSVVLVRLEQKAVEWAKVKEDMTRAWRRIFEQNYHKSLDHRSFYFKQAEKRNLLPKGLVSEIREVADRRRQDETYLKTVSSTLRHETIVAPDLTYDFSERLVLQDLDMVLRMAIGETVPVEFKAQVLDLFTELIEPMLGMRTRSEEVEARILLLQHGTQDDPADVTMADAKALGDSATQETQEGSANENENEGDDDDDTSEDGRPDGKQKVEVGRGSAEATSVAASSGEQDSAVENRDASNQLFRSCRPLAPYLGPAASEGGEAEASEAGKPKFNILFGNELMYVFFRFHRILYERLATARKCAQQKGSSQQRSEGIVTPELLEESTERLHNSFMQMLLRVVAGKLEPSIYEDRCRALLGTNSYELFTLDKLTAKIVKHMQVMVQDDQTARLWDLFRYERSRSTPVNCTVYLINSHTVMDDVLYKMHYDLEANVLGIQQMDPDKSESLVGADGYLTEYIRSFVNTPAARPKDSKLFLGRNLPEAVLSEKASDELALQALKTVHVLNGLECKISCATSRVSYVLDTEDILCRKHRIAEHRANKAVRTARFSKWLERHDVSRDD